MYLDEKNESPDSFSVIWGGGFRIYPAETVPAILAKFPKVAVARLTAPEGLPVFVNAANVTDRDDRSSNDDSKKTKSVLLFGPGALAPRIKVKETYEDLKKIWEKLGLPTDALT